MSDKNSIEIQGNLTRDAELKYTSGGLAICKFAIACSESHKKDNGEWENIPSFFDIVCFGKLAERKNQVLTKGSRADIFGRLKQERWEKDGQVHSRVTIIANDVDLIQKPNSKAATGSPSSNAAPPMEDGNPPDFPDDIPF